MGSWSNAGDVTTMDFSDDELSNIAAAINDCVPNFLVAAFTEGGGISPDDAQCLVDALPSDLIETVVIGGFRDEEPPDDFTLALFDAFAECDVIPSG